MDNMISPSNNSASSPLSDIATSPTTDLDLPQDAVDFCTRLADVAALQYSRHLQQFAKDYGPSDAKNAGRCSPDFPSMCEVFCSALRMRFAGDSGVESDAQGLGVRNTMSRPATACGGIVNSTLVTAASPASRRRVSRSTSPPAERQSGTKLRRSLTKRMPSFLRPAKRSDNSLVSGGRKQKPLKKEGVLQQLVDVDGGEIHWAKCRVVVKKDNSGHVISFFSPPKSAKPRSGVLCFLINEVRPTTALELPDCRHSFVIKGINGMEYVLDCSSQDEMHSWVNTIKTCSRLDNTKRPRGSMTLDASALTTMDYDEAENSPVTGRPQRRHTVSSPARVSLNSTHSDASRQSSSSGAGSFNCRNSSARLSTTSLPAIRTLSNPLPKSPLPTLLSQAKQGSEKDEISFVQPSQNSSASDCFLQSPEDIQRYVEQTPSKCSQASGGGAVTTALQPVSIESQPWFHGQLSRQEAAALVCHGGSLSHGTFLVRESESREGVMVLTFNCQGKAKHLRLSVQADRTVKVQQWVFDNVFHAIDYFKIHPVPLECVTDGDVFLKSYVVSAMSTRTPSIAEEDDNDIETGLTAGATAGVGVRAQQIVALPPDSLTLKSPQMPQRPGLPLVAPRFKPSKSDSVQEATKLSDINPVVALPPEADLKPATCQGQGTIRGAPEPGRPRTYFIDGTGFHARNSYVVAN